MDKARIYVDLNEMVTEDIALLSKDDAKTDSQGNLIAFYDKMPVSIYSDDASAIGETDNLLAEGIAIKHDLKEHPCWEHIKWCVRIDWNSLVHESDLKFLQALPEEIKKHHNDLLLIRKCLLSFKDHGMDKESMLENLNKLRNKCDSETEDVLLDLMDFAAGWCNQDLSIYK